MRHSALARLRLCEGFDAGYQRLGFFGAPNLRPLHRSQLAIGRTMPQEGLGVLPQPIEIYMFFKNQKTRYTFGYALFAVRMGFIQWRQPGSVLA